MGPSFLSRHSHNGSELNVKRRQASLTASPAKRLRKRLFEMIERRALMTVVAQGIQSLQAVEGIVAEQAIIGLPQTSTETAGVPLGKHSGIGFGEMIAGIRQDISAGPQSFVAAIDWRMASSPTATPSWTFPLPTLNTAPTACSRSMGKLTDGAGGLVAQYAYGTASLLA